MKPLGLTRSRRDAAILGFRVTGIVGFQDGLGFGVVESQLGFVGIWIYGPRTVFQPEPSETTNPTQTHRFRNPDDRTQPSTPSTGSGQLKQ